MTTTLERQEAAHEEISSGRRLFLRKSLALVSILAFAKLAIVLLVYLLSPLQVTSFPSVYPSSQGLTSLIRTFGNLWDAMNYVDIAKFGYPTYDALSPSKLYAFSPVYPALIYVGHFLTDGSFFTSAFLATNILGFIFPLIVMKLYNFRTALLLEVFPTYLVFTTVAYSDALALIFLGLAFMCFFKRRYLLTGLALGAAALVLYDLFLAVPPFLVYMLFFQNDRKARHYLGMLVPVLVTGASLLVAYQVTTGSPFTFFVLERALWGVKLSNPIAQIRWLLTPNETGSLNQLWVLFGFQLSPTYWVVRNLLFEAFLFGGLFLLTRIEDPRKWLFVIYSTVLSVFLLFIVGTTVYSIPRLMLAAFPIFAGYSIVIRRRWQMGVYVVVCVLASFWVILSYVYAFSA